MLFLQETKLNDGLLNQLKECAETCRGLVELNSSSKGEIVILLDIRQREERRICSNLTIFMCFSSFHQTFHVSLQAEQHLGQKTMMVLVARKGMAQPSKSWITTMVNPNRTTLDELILTYAYTLVDKVIWYLYQRDIPNIW